MAHAYSIVASKIIKISCYIERKRLSLSGFSDLAPKWEIYKSGGNLSDINVLSGLANLGSNLFLGTDLP